MKNFVRCILIGVCVSLGYGLARASTQVSVDTVAFCFAPGESIKGNIIASAFSDFLKKDSLMILGKGTDTVSYKVAYKDFQIEFTGNGVIGGTGPLNNIHSEQTIGTATGDLKNQYIQCTVSYIRNIQFEFKESFFQSNTDNSDSLVEHWKHELFGEKSTDLPTAVLQSKRSWRCVVRIRKSLPPNETFAIEGDTCLGNSARFQTPEKYADMSCRWSGGTGILIWNKNAHEISVTTRGMSSLTTFVKCTVYGCNDIGVSSTLPLRVRQTPASELTFDDCLPTASRGITVTASNPVPGVHYEWVGLSDVREISSDSRSETIRYPVSGSDNFTIRLKTTGGCLPSWKDTIVHRKLGSDVKLLALDSCLAAGIPFRMATDPQLPNMELTWSLPAGCYLVGFSGSDARKDKVTIRKNASMIGQTASVKVSDEVCKGSTSEYISISESYTEMEARLAGSIANGLLLHDGDSVPPGEKIKFTAPVHSSISGYTWFISCNDGSPSRALRGESELTVTAPTNGYTITVSVSYKSCFGSQSHTYRLKSMDEFNRLFGE